LAGRKKRSGSMMKTKFFVKWYDPGPEFYPSTKNANFQNSVENKPFEL